MPLMTPAVRPQPVHDGGGRRRDLALSVRDGTAHAVMLGAGEAYLAAYAIFLGLDALAIGLLASLPLLVGSLAQMASIRHLDGAPSRRRLVVSMATVQGLLWLPLALLPQLDRAHAAAWLLGLAMAYFACGGFMTPAWNSWIGDLVPPRLRGGFFGRREQLRSAGQLAGLVGAGAALATARRSEVEWLGFGAIFAVALGARLLSARYLHATREPSYQPIGRGHAFSLVDFLRRAPSSNFGRFAVGVGLFMASTFVAAPFFAVFMLRDLGFDYVQFTCASATVLVAGLVTVRSWGRLGDRFGNRLLLRVTGLAVPFVPILWVVSSSFGAILIWQALGGVLWAGFNLSTSNFLFDAVTPAKRPRCVAYYNLVVNVGSLAGAIVGGLLVTRLPAELPWPGGAIALGSSVEVLFVLSGLARLAVAVGLLSLVREVRPVAHFGGIFVRVAGLAASRGLRLTIFPATETEAMAAEPSAGTQPSAAAADS